MRTQPTKPRDLQTTPVSQTWDIVAVFASAVEASLDRWLNEHWRIGLTDYRALLLLSQSPQKELRIASLAQQVGLTSTSTTRLVSRLEEKGLAKRDVCQEDGRGVYAVIDPVGEELLWNIQVPYEAHVSGLLDDPTQLLAPVDVKPLANALREVATRISP